MVAGLRRGRLDQNGWGLPRHNLAHPRNKHQAPSPTRPTPVGAQPKRALPDSIDGKAKRLADFFNGEGITDFSDDMT